MPASKRTYITKELSPNTWPDFVKLFSPKSGWNHCWCVHFHRPRPLPKEKWLATRAERAKRNRREQKSLLDRGCSHGILVYLDGEPVGWCQYGRRDELARIDNLANYKKSALINREAQQQKGTSRKNSPPPPQKLWRITCFVVAKNHRRQGIAGAALRAALHSIKKKGGGLVEAYPVENWSSGSFGNMSTHGAVSMFRKEHFQIVAPLNNTNVVMRRAI